MDLSGQPEVSLLETTRHRLRIVSGLEVLSLLLSALVITWGVVPLLPANARWLALIAALPALTLVLYSIRVRGEGWGDLGLTLLFAAAALKRLLIPTGVAMGIFVWIGWRAGSLHLYDPFLQGLLVFPLSGIAQQTILQGIVHRRLREMLCTSRNGSKGSTRWIAIGLTGVLFCLLHAPNIPLMGLTLVGGLIWSWVYDRAPNLLILGISHGMISLLIACTLPATMLNSLSVGYKHLLYQVF
jgi:membrane protease YdiL (CAAX protease family)